MIVDRTDQVWEYRDSDDRYVIAWIYEPADTLYHNVTVFFSVDTRLWQLGIQRWAEGYNDPYESDPQFTRLL